MIREPARAGSFYPGSADRCQEEASSFVTPAPREVAGASTLVGGIVPHAGWTFSGAVAGKVFATLAASRKPETVVIFGAVHVRRGEQAWLFGSGRWNTPLGQAQIDDRLAERILGHTNLILNDPYAHEQEHSIEVQIPLLQSSMPECRIVPIMVPPMTSAVEVGDAVARTIESYGYDAMVVGSTDLTHYGPSYGMVPQGVGPAGIAWAKDVNDRRMVELILSLEADRIVPEAAEHHNACGAGAVAATVAAVKRLGAAGGILLAHTTSFEVLSSRSEEDSVGYAGVVFAAE
ncbi:MAG: AmmeMemoRadiSam system protein B [Planctomycetota bacterium]|jgi:AmmeMemoRadiSam system protein B